MATQVNPLLGATPVVSPLGTPAGAKKGTHTLGPLVSGHTDFVKGVAMLAYRFDVSGANGNFGGSAPGVLLQFPPGTILWKLIGTVDTAFNGTTPVLGLGTAPGGTQLASVALSAGNVETPTSPAILVTPSNGKVFVSVTGAPTTGHGSFAILYLGSPALPWS
jgi:hypothetical protein